MSAHGFKRQPQFSVAAFSHSDCLRAMKAVIDSIRGYAESQIERMARYLL
jgi:hypothetical protein